MLLCRKKLFFLASIIIAAFLSASSAAYAEAEDTPAEKSLQPQALKAANIHTLKALEPNLNGTGVDVAVICRSLTYIDGQPQNDYQPDTAHNCFKSARFTFHDRNTQPPAISPHSTAICSILFGEDTDSFNSDLGSFNYQGAVPAANAQIYEFWNFLTDVVFNQIEPDFDIVTASIGNHAEQWWTRGIDSLAEKYGTIVIAAIGNGSKAYDPVLFPAAGANAIGVGLINSVNTDDLLTNLSNFSLSYPEHSSFGPTIDGRCKPDIVAPGNCLAAAINAPDLYQPAGNWTSFAAPIVTGTAALLVQKAKQDQSLSEALLTDCGNCLIKAVLMNSAAKLPFWHKGRLTKDDDHTAPLDLIQGSGMVDAAAAFEQLTAGRNTPGDVHKTGWDLNRLEEQKILQNIYRITIPDANQKTLTATAVWNKHYKNTYPFEPDMQKDANIRLELWAINTQEPAEDYLLDYSDSPIDNVEHIYSSLDANCSTYEIIVSYSNTDNRQILPEQTYAIAWNVSEKQNSDNIFLYDLNADGIVDKSDHLALFDNWINSTRSPAHYFIGDINTDCLFDSNDILLLTEQMNRKAEWYHQ